MSLGETLIVFGLNLVELKYTDLKLTGDDPAHEITKVGGFHFLHYQPILTSTVDTSETPRYIRIEPQTTIPEGDD